MKKSKKLKSGAKNIGGTVLPTGIDLDPNNDFTLIEDSEKGQEAYYKDEQIPYLDYFGELAERETITNGGADTYRKTSVGLFSGFGQGTLKKSYKEN
tara:strand:+ start:1165 stop:1455 length:291 start_codon:yes stop_codon:yes gene_type:complete